VTVFVTEILPQALRRKGTIPFCEPKFGKNMRPAGCKMLLPILNLHSIEYSVYAEFGSHAVRKQHWPLLGDLQTFRFAEPYKPSA